MNKALEGETRLVNAKRRKEEHESKGKEAPEKRKILQDLEDQICSEQDLGKLDQLYKDYGTI